jgi:sulfite dehydrogenase (cytochrome) subunit B
MPSIARPEPLAVCALVACTAWPFASRAADESALALVEGPGRERTQAACSMCHSLDYIIMNSPFQDQAGWEKTVQKMTTVYGAPLTADEAAAIVAYLSRHYGR